MTLSFNWRTMATVVVSSKYHVVIPEEIKSKLKQAVQNEVAIAEDGIIHVIPPNPI